MTDQTQNRTGLDPHTVRLLLKAQVTSNQKVCYQCKRRLPDSLVRASKVNGRPMRCFRCIDVEVPGVLEATQPDGLIIARGRVSGQRGFPFFFEN